MYTPMSKKSTAPVNGLILYVCSTYTLYLAESESEKSIGVEVTVDDDVIIGQDFFVRALITNKTDTTR